MTLGDWLESGEFTLVLSAGFFGFFAHCGVLRGLELAGLEPTALAGSSAGALAGGFWAAGMGAATMERELTGLRRADFWDPWPGLGLLRGRKLERRLRDLLPVEHFEEVRRKEPSHGLWRRGRSSSFW